MQVDWDNLRVFIELHRSGTLAAAGRVLGMDPTTVGRRIERLEADLGGKLFVHTPDGFELADLGRHILASTEQVERHAIAVQRQAAGEHVRMEGNVRITCSSGMGAYMIVPQLPRFRAAHPRIEVELLTGYQLADIARREADLAVRVTADGAAVPLSGGGADEIIARQISRLGFGLYASQDYIDRRGGLRGRAAAPLAGHDVIAPTSLAAGSPVARWITEHARDATVSIRCDDQPSIMAAARAGFGIALLTRHIADTDPGLRRLDQGDGLFFRQIWLLVHRDLQHTARIVAMRDFLTEVFAAINQCRP